MKTAVGHLRRSVFLKHCCQSTVSVYIPNLGTSETQAVCCWSHFFSPYFISRPSKISLRMTCFYLASLFKQLLPYCPDISRELVIIQTCLLRLFVWSGIIKLPLFGRRYPTLLWTPSDASYEEQTINLCTREHTRWKNIRNNCFPSMLWVNH